jgi:hypothetical protein
MGPDTKSGFCLMIVFLSIQVMVYIHHSDAARFPSLKSALQEEQSRIIELLTSLVNTPNIDKCIAPGAKIPISIKATIDDVINKLIEIKNKVKCEESTDNKPTTTTTTTTTSKKVKQCRILENEEMICVEAVEDGDKTTIKVIKNDKVIKETKLPSPLTTVMETQLDELFPTTEPVTKKVTQQKVTLPTGDVIEVEVIEEDDSTVVITKKNGDVISEKPTKGNPVSIIEEVIRKYIPQEPKDKVPTTNPTTTTPKTVKQCRTSSNGDVTCIQAIEDGDTTIIKIIVNDKVVKQTKVPVSITSITETQIDKLFPPSEPVTKKITQRRVTLPNGDIIEVIVIQEDDTTTVITKKNGEPVSKKPTKGNPLSIIEEEIRKYIREEPSDKPTTSTSTSTTSTTTKRGKKCIQPNDEDIVCVEVVQEDDEITVTIKKNGKTIETKKTTGEIPNILNKEIKKYLPNDEETNTTDSQEKTTKRVTKRTKCVTKNDEEKICIEVTQIDDKVTVITKKNDKVVDTKVVTGDVEEILNETIKKYTTSTTDEKGPNNKPRPKKTTECVSVNNEYTICTEITTEDDQVTSIITKKDGKVINPDDQPTEIQEIITRIIKKYTSGGKTPATSKTIRKTTKCVTLTNGDTICVETTEYPDKTIVKTIKNNKVIDESETSETVTEVIEQILSKYTKTPKGKKPPVKKVKKCRIVDNGETICVEIIEEDETLIITTTKDNEVVSRKTTTGNVNDVLESEFNKYITIISTEQSVKRRKTRCITKSNDDTYCVEVIEENNKLTVIVKKNGVIIKSRVTKGDFAQVLEDEVKEYVEDTSTQSGKSKFITKCGGPADGDQYCVEVTEENNIYRVVIKKNGISINSFTRDTSQTITKVLNDEFGKYMTQIMTSVETKATATKNKCRTFASGDRVCVSVREGDGIKTVETSKNDTRVRSRKTKDSFDDIFKKEFDDFKS